MLPTHHTRSGTATSTSSSSSLLLKLTYTEYAARMVRFRQMDFEYALWLMLNLIISPRTAFRSTLYHSRTKHQWARDDPAFVVVLLYLLLVASVSWSFAFAWRTPLQVLGLFAYVACVDFLLLGVALSTIGWWFANAYLHEQAQSQLGALQASSSHVGGSAYARLASRAASGASWAIAHGAAAAERRSGESVEWLYAFDVHCNAFLPIYLLLYLAQYLLLPVLLRPGLFARFLANGLYALAFSSYHYLTFLGYSEMPFLTKCEVFVYPIALVLLAFALSLPLGVNCSALVVYIYFG